ncbi:hypothetical protein AB205_0196920 [Aquarana catesbeiana]|uniref:Uncharacterized protein n=1 Tax=Aquarana catesbeiana TaxID=8400 RepID=A0A2G9SA48_AQUCT|nr:hypothetical protein AB205_0196920 [Aquarana catesbeiana]
MAVGGVSKEQAVSAFLLSLLYCKCHHSSEECLWMYIQHLHSDNLTLIHLNAKDFEMTCCGN